MVSINDLSVEKIREIISTESLEYIKRCINDKVDHYLIIKSFPGSGKSTSIMKTIDENHLNWIYLSPFHDIITDNLHYSKLRNYEFIHLKGKNREGMCRVPQYRRYAKQGINIDSFCESKCPYRESNCPYYKRKEQVESFPQSWAGVHHHVPSYLQKFLYQIEYNGKLMINWFDVIIIDEFPFQVMYSQINITKNDIDKLRDVLSYMEECDELDFCMIFLDELLYQTENIKLKYQQLCDTIQDSVDLDFKSFKEKYDKKLLSLVSNDTIEKPPKSILWYLMEFYDRSPTVEELEWMIKPHSADDYTSRGIYLTISNVDKFQQLNLPIIALDATANTSAWESLLGGKCKEKHIDIQYSNLYQMRTRAKYPLTSWISVQNRISYLRDTGLRLARLIRKICRNKQRSVLLCSNKRLMRTLRKWLQDNYEGKNYKFAIFYNLRSRNDFYKECDTCIVTHQPNVPPLQLKIMENVIGWNRDILQNLMTRSEVLQAIGRIRQNLKTVDGEERERIEIFIFPGAVGDDRILPEAQLITYDQMGYSDEEKVDFSVYLMSIIRDLESISFETLYEYLCENGYVSRTLLRKELKQLYMKGYITNWKRNIAWDFESEQERLKTKFKYIK